MIKFFVFLSLLSSWAWALEVDSKLTLRIVKVSSSQKTILINRGIEDGLEKNNHAKFYLSTGVVARGVVVKVSPTRSVWSLYRIINNNYIIKDQVLKLKITTELKVTKDESRALVNDDQSDVVITNDPRNLGIPLAEGADDFDPLEEAKRKAEMKDLEWQIDAAPKTTSKKIEASASGSFENLSSVTKDGSAEFSGADNKVNFNLELEYYLQSLEGKLANLSLRFIYSLSDSSTISYQGSTAKESINEYGGGLSYHFYSPTILSKINPYIDFSLLIGSVTSSYTPGAGVTGTEQSVTGSTTLIGFGGGMKYFTAIGISFRAKLEYVSRTLKFSASQVGSSEYDKTQSGPRVIFGAGYRF